MTQNQSNENPGNNQDISNREVKISPWSIFAQSPIQTLIVNKEGKVIQYNQAVSQLAGYDPEELPTLEDWSRIVFPDEEYRKNVVTFSDWKDYEKQKVSKKEYSITCKSGEIKHIRFSSFIITSEDKSCDLMIVLGDDITWHKTLEKRQQLMIDILTVLNLSENKLQEKEDTIYKILFLIKEFANVDAVGIRLRKGSDYPYYTASGFSDDFVKHESHLCGNCSNGASRLDSNGKPVLDCLCGCVISGNSDPGNLNFTPGGSFWTASTTEFVNTISNASGNSNSTFPVHLRNRCNTEGYESVALIPLIVEDEIIGLLQLNDKRTAAFTEELVQFFERVAMGIGIAFRRKTKNIPRNNKEKK